MKSYGIQLYSVKDSMIEKGMRATLSEIAALGYKYVEFAGFFDHTAEEVKAMLDEFGLTCTGAHAGLDDLRPAKIMQTVAYHKAVGNPNYIIPWEDLSTLEKIEDFCNVMNFAQPILAAEGIKLSYHNHSEEFDLMPWGSTIFSELERRTKIEFEIDTFWTFNAGLDTIATLKRLGVRVRVIHLMDGHKGGKTAPLGCGEAPVKTVADYAHENNLTVVVETETWTPSGMDEATVCMNYLKSID